MMGVFSCSTLWAVVHSARSAHTRFSYCQPHTSQVYRCCDVTSPKGERSYYAVKVLKKPRARSRQERYQAHELALHHRVSGHPSIVSFHKVITDSKHVYVVLNLCDGGDLFSAITERNLYFGNDALIKSVFLQILDAVHHCHTKGVYHRDLKPENIFCSKDGATMYIGDFGLATDKEITKDYGCGSKFYMSPECIGKEIVLGEFSNARSDIWSLGVVLTNLVSGRNPWGYAVSSDACFAAYMRDPNFLLTVLPISEAANNVLKRIFVINPLRRISLPGLRAEIEDIRTFYASDVELAVRETELGDVDIEVKNAQNKDEVAPSIPASDEHYIYPSPADEAFAIPDSAVLEIIDVLPHPSPEAEVSDADAPIEQDGDIQDAVLPPSPAGPLAAPAAEDTVDFLAPPRRPFDAETGSTTSSADSEAPITPATYPLADDVEIPDFAEGEGIGQSRVLGSSEYVGAPKYVDASSMRVVPVKVSPLAGVTIVDEGSAGSDPGSAKRSRGLSFSKLFSKGPFSKIRNIAKQTSGTKA
ncbi:Pkinase-domain-containing protein [Schizophyllum commune H4-8]|uniref:Pkinase-domain-containing protein n=1 Tax=Schizophyllum commune (strain H4-8 / FGSC 9210) TaxID=578458 RepID=UPI0021607EF0|nr:Pkinase-domain-containing protein [Schizophyllum commune H4-8]KAI5893463.1 Pkinase-domain-containing protein [Schizophyllum commune H4-8]